MAIPPCRPGLRRGLDGVCLPGARARRAWEPAVVRLVLGVGLVAGLFALFAGLNYDWDFGVFWRYRALWLRGLGVTATVSLGAMCVGMLLGLAGGLARVSRSLWLSEAAGLYVAFFRGTPLLSQIYIFYFCIAVALHVDNAAVAGTAALGFFAGSYITEMVRAGIAAIPVGQWEAGLATGLSFRQTMRHIILPQALRLCIAPVTGQFVSIVKDSSLLSIIAVHELTKGAEMINAATYKTFEAYLPLAVIYLGLTYPLALLTYRLERRIHAPTDAFLARQR